MIQMAAEGSIREASQSRGSKFSPIRERTVRFRESFFSRRHFVQFVTGVARDSSRIRTVKGRRLGMPRSVEKAAAFSISGDTDYALLSLGEYRDDPCTRGSIPDRPLSPVDLSVGSLTAKSRHFRDHDPVSFRPYPPAALDTPEELSERTAAETRESEEKERCVMERKSMSARMCVSTDINCSIGARRILIHREDCANASIYIKSMLEALLDQSRDATLIETILKGKRKHPRWEDSRCT